VLQSVCAAAAFLLFCVWIQRLSGAWSAAFVAYPDEPSHFVGSVMFRQWLLSGRWLSPLAFAQDYYAHYPYFAVGYWPPLFTVMTGTWMLIAGVGRVQALLISVFFAAGTACLIHQFVRRRAGIAAGVCAGFLFLSLSAVRQWICAVMIDHVTTFLCLATAYLLIRYLEQPDLWKGSLCGIVSACAILSKYSAGYVVLLPFLAVLVLRRLELLKSLSLLIQPLIVGFMVGPWFLWTRKLTFYGLPAEHGGYTKSRAVGFLLETIRMFPPALLVVVAFGLMVLLFRPRAWRVDVCIWSLLCAAHLVFLVGSPVSAEARYLMLPAAVLLALSFAGWSELGDSIFTSLRWAQIVPAAVSLVTAGAVIWQVRQVTRLPQGQIGEVVAFVIKTGGPAPRRIVVPSNLDGAFIAEFAAQSPKPKDYLLRPNKILARSDWFGLNYSSFFSTPEEMMNYFRRQPVNLIVWNQSADSAPKAHAAVMSAMLTAYPLSWPRVLSFDRGSSTWMVCQYQESTESGSHRRGE
jgi:4-amino-4-deoxy-L-arabinose transferase-like glycosyltransferase